MLEYIYAFRISNVYVFHLGDFDIENFSIIPQESENLIPLCGATPINEDNCYLYQLYPPYNTNARRNFKRCKDKRFCEKCLNHPSIMYHKAIIGLRKFLV